MTQSSVASFSAIPGWDNDRHDLALAAFQKSCTAANKRSGEQALPANLCLIAQQTADFNAKAFFEEYFEPVRQPVQAHFTAYFEPELEGSRTYSPPYIYPLYAKPPEMRNGQRYLTRAQINANALQGRGLEIAYLKDPVDRFFLHVQGSGRVKLINGGVMRIGFAAKNGHPYRSVGKEMVARGLARPGQASAGYIKDWVRNNPVQGRRLLEHNTSYIFFQELTDLSPLDGPKGALQVPLTPMRSIAVDPSYVSLGLPVWVNPQTTSPAGTFPRLMIAQDVGSAIKGQARGDLFFGAGQAAGDAAGRINTAGTFIVLRPKKQALRVSQIQAYE